LVFENPSKAFISSPSAMLLDCGSPNRPGFRSSAAKGDLARKVGLTTVSSFEFMVPSFK
jgi:hypothetical protein